MGSLLYTKMIQWMTSVVGLYIDGFRQMTVGRTLWKVIFVKLFIIFVLLKIFFFSNNLQTNFPTDRQRADHVLEHLTWQTGTQAEKHQKRVE